MEYVVLVDELDNELGLMEKMEAHEKGALHRAFSVFTFNSKGELLLQRRALSKYHSAGLWTNTCCSHPRESESTIDAAHRRLQEEMGFDCELTKAFDFIYKKKMDKGLIEHELDHVFIGRYDGQPNINRDEVDEYKNMPIDELVKDIEEFPNKYTEWFKICLEETLRHQKGIGV
jgi:isopentenyl-diphosphate delta-isomerase